MLQYSCKYLKFDQILEMKKSNNITTQVGKVSAQINEIVISTAGESNSNLKNFTYLGLQ